MRAVLYKCAVQNVTWLSDCHHSPQTVSLRNGSAENAAGLQDHCSDVNVFGESSNLLTLESPVYIVGSSENHTDGLLLNPAVHFYLGPDVSDEKGRMLELS